MYEIFHYVTKKGVDVFDSWLVDLADTTAIARIVARVERMQAGNFGDHKSVAPSIWELRVDHGPGYRVYYAFVGRQVVLLLCGGDKRKQSADIKRAVEMHRDYIERTTKS